MNATKEEKVISRRETKQTEREETKEKEKNSSVNVECRKRRLT